MNDDAAQPSAPGQRPRFTGRPELPPVPGLRVYEAVLDHDVTTPQQFDAWLTARA